MSQTRNSYQRQSNFFFCFGVLCWELAFNLVKNLSLQICGPTPVPIPAAFWFYSFLKDFNLLIYLLSHRLRKLFFGSSTGEQRLEKLLEVSTLDPAQMFFFHMTWSDPDSPNFPCLSSVFSPCWPQRNDRFRFLPTTKQADSSIYRLLSLMTTYTGGPPGVQRRRGKHFLVSIFFPQIPIISMIYWTRPKHLKNKSSRNSWKTELLNHFFRWAAIINNRDSNGVPMHKWNRPRWRSKKWREPPIKAKQKAKVFPCTSLTSLI